MDAKLGFNMLNQVTLGGILLAQLAHPANVSLLLGNLGSLASLNRFLGSRLALVQPFLEVIIVLLGLGIFIVSIILVTSRRPHVCINDLLKGVDAQLLIGLCRGDFGLFYLLLLLIYGTLWILKLR